MECAAKGNLHHHIKSFRTRPLPEPRVWTIFLHTLLGLRHMHEQNILHRDIKSLNIFLDANDTCKLGDLGVAKVRPREAKARARGLCWGGP